MARPLLSDELWALVEPLIPKVERRFRFPGRKRIDDRKVLTGILFVLKCGIPWEMLPQEMGCGSGMTCWRRLKEWQEAGVWERLHRKLLNRLAELVRMMPVGEPCCFRNPYTPKCVERVFSELRLQDRACPGPIRGESANRRGPSPISHP